MSYLPNACVISTKQSNQISLEGYYSGFIHYCIQMLCRNYIAWIVFLVSRKSFNTPHYRPTPIGCNIIALKACFVIADRLSLRLIQQRFRIVALDRNFSVGWTKTCHQAIHYRMVSLKKAPTQRKAAGRYNLSDVCQRHIIAVHSVIEMSLNFVIL